jgi:hypothetical protein
MEPPNQTPDTKPLKQGIYSAVGWIAGTYKPSAENVGTGIFTTTDGLSVPAKFTRRLRCHLEKKHPTQYFLFKTEIG